ncbi:MAG TPA: DEAD/DEAH box helicase [Thermoanaerobaculales bacterium]|nr:DEAD/DEAH box helicase [Thermoanaerobaculales bacterium]
MSDYEQFLARKRRVWTGAGIDAKQVSLPAALYPWQQAIVRWALRKGRAAIFADCGLGKTFMQVAWAQSLGVTTLILAPLCVAEQTVAEAAKLGVRVRYAQDHADWLRSREAITITNYERLHLFQPQHFSAVVLDESSILKAFDGATRNLVINAFRDTKYRLCCTATPSPNDISELANHAEFLGLMTRPEFLATWFIRIGEGHRTTTRHGWRMKRHAVEPFYRWMSSWAVALRSPADLGYDDAAFNLPPLTIHDAIVDAAPPEGALFHGLALKGIEGRLAARRGSLADRVDAAVQLAQRPGQWIFWCGLNAESDALAHALPDAVNVQGSDGYAEKVGAVQGFMRGDIRILISKPKILGFGLNLQCCHQMAFMGLSDSYETYYQCLRRCWRFGQRRPVDAYVIVSEAEQVVAENVRRKEAMADSLSRALLQHVAAFEREELVA